MYSRIWIVLVISAAFFLGRSASVAANILSSCADVTAAFAESCSSPLENITVVESGEFVIAKLQCYGCSTVARLDKGSHHVTHEENALVCTPIWLSPINLYATYFPFTDAAESSSSISASRTTALSSSSTPSHSSLPSRPPLHRSSTLPKSHSISASPPSPLLSNALNNPAVTSMANATASQTIWAVWD